MPYAQCHRDAPNQWVVDDTIRLEAGTNADDEIVLDNVIETYSNSYIVSLVWLTDTDHTHSYLSSG